MIYLCITPDREQKTRMMMDALSMGFIRIGEEAKQIFGAPPEDEFPFVVWGQEWTAMEAIPKAVKQNRPFWHLDNGFWNPAKGTDRGYYRFAYKSMTPIYLENRDLRLPTARLEPWRKGGNHILLAMPGVHFGVALGIDVKTWCDEIVLVLRDLCESVGRPLRIRERNSIRNLRDDLLGARAVVTHSSNVAVDAVISGVPVFVQSTSPAAPVGKLDLDLNSPITPGRDRWIKSLASQQFTIAEMRDGIAQRWMKRIEQEANIGSSQREAQQ